MFSPWLWAAFRAALLGALLVGVSLPLLFSLHRHFELGAPPLSALWTLGLGVVGSFVGAAIIGRFLGRFGGRRASGALAAFSGFVWGTALSFLLMASYGGAVSRAALHQAETQSDEHLERMNQNPGETAEQARAGHASKDAALASVQFSNDAREATISGSARVPGMALLMWAILVPPALCAFECRRARR